MVIIDLAVTSLNIHMAKFIHFFVDLEYNLTLLKTEHVFFFKHVLCIRQN